MKRQIRYQVIAVEEGGGRVIEPEHGAADLYKHANKMNISCWLDVIKCTFIRPTVIMFNIKVTV